MYIKYLGGQIMVRIILNVFIVTCQLCAISMIFLKWFVGFKWTEKVFALMRKHGIVVTLYIVFSSIGLFYAIAHI